ncbi:MAG TPA: tetratricopeptide repeat protein [Gemmatimonadales bacterium]|nr:tetratricopeptide repeat protein [Gemmatimonadales bacterium]
MSAARVLAKLTVAVALLQSCGRVGDHERRGDEAYGQGRFTEALGEYRIALANDLEPRLLAKVGAASLRTGNLEVAADAYLRLAAEDPTRAEEAAEGLDAVARAADRTGDGKRLEAAVIGLGMIAPNRAIGRYALSVIRRPGAEATDLVSVLPAAIATAPDAETVDSLLTVYGAALHETSGCDQALPLYQSVVRRTKSMALRQRAEDGVAACSVVLGLRAEAGGRPAEAELWFSAAIQVDSATAVGRRALVGYGDALLRLGDTAAAAAAYRSVLADLVQSDSTTQMARDRFEELRARAAVGPHTILR